jgi:hypothetical protein
MRCLPFVVTLASLLAVAACGLNEFSEQENRLKPLVQRRAGKEDVIALLGSTFVDYSRNHTNAASLVQFLSREPKNRLVAVRERVAKWPNVMYYSTPEMMTWVFLDQEGKVVDFVVGAQ